MGASCSGNMPPSLCGPERRAGGQRVRLDLVRPTGITRRPWCTFSVGRRRRPPPRSANSSRRSKAISAGRRKCRGSAAPLRRAASMLAPVASGSGDHRIGHARRDGPRAAAGVAAGRSTSIGSGIDCSNEPPFVEANAHRIYYGPVYLHRESEPYMTLALAGPRGDAGVSVAKVNLRFIWDVVSQIKVGENGELMSSIRAAG